MEVDGGQQDDRRREVKGSDAKPVDHRERRPHSQECDRGVHGVSQARVEAVGSAKESEPGRQGGDAGDGQPRERQKGRRRAGR